MMISIAVGGIGFFIAFSKGWRERKKMLHTLPKDTAESILEGEETLREILSSHTFIFLMVLVPAFMYTVLGAVLINTIGVETAPQMRVAVGGFLALGLSSFFANTGRSLIFEEVMNGLNERKAGSRKDYGKYMIFLLQFETPAIFGLLLFIYGVVFSGILEGTADLSMASANMYFYGTLIFGLSTVSTLFMGWNFKRVKGPVNEDQDIFKKKNTRLALPQPIFLTGLTIAILLMVESGMIG